MTTMKLFFLYRRHQSGNANVILVDFPWPLGSTSTMPSMLPDGLNVSRNLPGTMAFSRSH